MDGYDFTCIVWLCLLSALILPNLSWALAQLRALLSAILVILVTRAECARSEFSHLETEKPSHKYWFTVNFKPLQNQCARVSSLKLWCHHAVTWLLFVFMRSSLKRLSPMKHMDVITSCPAAWTRTPFVSCSVWPCLVALNAEEESQSWWQWRNVIFWLKNGRSTLGWGGWGGVGWRGRIENESRTVFIHAFSVFQCQRSSSSCVVWVREDKIARSIPHFQSWASVLV